MCLDLETKWWNNGSYVTEYNSPQKTKNYSRRWDAAVKNVVKQYTAWIITNVKDIEVVLGTQRTNYRPTKCRMPLSRLELLMVKGVHHF